MALNLPKGVSKGGKRELLLNFSNLRAQNVVGRTNKLL